MTYINYLKNKISSYDVSAPIYTSQLAVNLSEEFGLASSDAAAAVSVAIKRLMDSKALPELRYFRKGIYYRTNSTPFGETGISIETLISDKYLSGDNGYETGLSLLHRMGLTTQIPANRVIVSNRASGCIRNDSALGIYTCPPKVRINKDNKRYLQILDAIDAMQKAPVDAAQPYKLVADIIQSEGLDYGKLLSIASKYYRKNTIISLARIASERSDNNL